MVGTSRDAQISSFSNLRRLGILDQVESLSMVLTDFRSVLQVLKRVQPDEIYNLAGQSSVSLSFQQPVETFESITLGSINLIESINFIDKAIRTYFAGSGEVFGDTGAAPANEDSPYRPKSPYAAAKAAAAWIVANYREAYGHHVCTGLLFNHESPLRPHRFVTRKIVNVACRIACGERIKLELGDLAIRRDWGWAPEYVEAMWLMLQREKPQDFVIATGRQHSLETFGQMVFSNLGLELRDHLVQSQDLVRPLEIRGNCGDASKAHKELGWQPKTQLTEIACAMVNAELEALNQGKDRQIGAWKNYEDFDLQHE